MAEEITRRNLLKGAAVGAASMGVIGVLSACSSGASTTEEKTEEAPAEVEEKTEETADTAAAAAAAAATEFEMVLGADKGSNFNILTDAEEVHGPTSTTDDTLANLNSAMGGETGAFTKYTAFSEKAAKDGFDRIAALFKATAAAEDLHRHLEEQVAQKLDPNAALPDAPDVSPYETDCNIIAGARGEIYETSDMYPTYIAKAIEEAEAETDADRKAALEEAVQVFTRAKLAEAYHAKWYMDAYTTIDTPTDESYWLCETCGFIHKGAVAPAMCPICGVKTFKEY